jgi:hypothetical protein
MLIKGGPFMKVEAVKPAEAPVWVWSATEAADAGNTPTPTKATLATANTNNRIRTLPRITQTPPARPATDPIGRRQASEPCWTAGKAQHHSKSIGNFGLQYRK